MNFTVLLPIYQRDDLENMFMEVIESIYKNTLIPSQLIILIDGHLNHSFQMKVENLKNRFGYDLFQPNHKMGLSSILNEGIKLSANEWIVRADGDDINLTNRFEILVKYMQKNYDLIGSHVIEINKSNNKKIIKKLPLNFNEIKNFSKIRNPFNHMSVAFKKSAVMNLNFYPDLYLKEDYGLWIKFISSNKYRVINIPDALVMVSANNDMYIRRGGLKYLKSEFELFKFKNSHHIHNFYEGIFIFFLRTTFLLDPNFIKILTYKAFLRKLY